jgi:hypothetical protein
MPASPPPSIFVLLVRIPFTAKPAGLDPHKFLQADRKLAAAPVRKNLRIHLSRVMKMSLFAKNCR